MHELSIAARVIDVAARHAAGQGGGRIVAVTLRIGRLSCVSPEALRQGFALLAEGTPCAGAALHVEEVPVRVWCESCREERELPGIQRLACPECGAAAGAIRAGRELDVESITVEDP